MKLGITERQVNRLIIKYKEEVFLHRNRTGKPATTFYVAKYFSFEPKVYSKRHIQKLIKLQEYKINEFNILGL